MLYVYDIAIDILIVRYDTDGWDHDRSLRQVMQICHEKNLKWNKNKYHFRCTKMVFCQELEPKKLCPLTESAPNN